jgi:RNA recognition motif-containing protein
LNIYVGNLPYTVDDDQLREVFENFGKITSAQIIIDRRTNRSRGYGFVVMDDGDEGLDAIQALNGSNLEGRTLRVDESTPRPDRGRRSRNEAPNRGSSRRPGSPHSGSSGGQRDTGTGLMSFFRKLFG